VGPIRGKRPISRELSPIKERREIGNQIEIGGEHVISRLKTEPNGGGGWTRGNGRGEGEFGTREQDQENGALTQLLDSDEGYAESKEGDWDCIENTRGNQS